jgi:hypothetical protein
VDQELTEEEIDALELQFIAKSGSAFHAAYLRSRAFGFSTTIREGDNVVEISPDGTRTIIKALEPLVPCKAGTKIQIR